MRRNIKTCLDLLGGGWPNFLVVSVVSDVLNQALNSGVTQLVMSQEEFRVIQSCMVGSGVWNWDKKTFMGMELIIEEENERR